jgi:ankyrin repeat protein
MRSRGLQSLKYSALHAAADMGQLDAIQYLVDNGAVVNRPHEVKAPVSGLCLREPSRRLELLTTATALCFASHAQLTRDTPLHFAIAANRVDAAVLLIRLGADPTLVNNVSPSVAPRRAVRG